jgi:hypothetical protein
MSDDHTYTLEDRIAEVETKTLVLQELLTYTVYLLGTNGRAAMVAHIDQLKSTWLVGNTKSEHATAAFAEAFSQFLTDLESFVSGRSD